MALAVVLVVLHGFSKANPHNVAIVLKATGGIGALAVAAILAVRGRIDLAVTLGIVGLSLLGWLPWSVAGFGARTAEEHRAGVAGALRLRRDGARSRHRRDARHHSRGPA